MNISLRGFDVRPAIESDVPRLVKLEQQCFGSSGLDLYDGRHMRCWLEVNPDGLLVAEQDKKVVGYRYSQYLDFCFDNIADLTTNDAFTDSGFTRATHRADGNSINGVSVCSVVPGAGRVLFEAIFEKLRETNRHFYFGFSRISGFDRYCHWLNANGYDTASIGIKPLATWYATQCATQVDGKVWGWVPNERLDLPSPEPDPVISKYLKHKGFGIAAILVDWLKDPPSRDVGVMVLYKNPNTP